ncbi:MAG: LicD family protein [Bacteroidales bacterium]|nr:LicD family protein [Bacteroidales bacterium]
MFLYLGRKTIDKAKALDNLRLLVGILDRKSLRYGPLFGTLLGIIRSDDFIDWDEDIDLYLLKEDEEAFLSMLPLLKTEGFDLVRYDKRGLYSLMRDGEYIDFYVLRKVSPELRHTGGADFIFERYLEDVTEYDFKGISLRVPKDVEQYLEFTYGDWRTPVQYFNYSPSSFEMFRMRFREWFKRCIPDSIYPLMIRIYRKKDLRKFLAKCAKKGIELHYPIHL